MVPDPGPGEALVGVRACGVCHTDLHYREGSINDEFPFLLGHEAAGTVEAVGAGGHRPGPGDYVVLAWRAPCGQCRSCRRGRPWYCFDSANAASPMTLTDGTALSPALGIGAFAEKTLVAAGQAVKVDPAARPEAAGLIGCGIMAGFGAVVNTGGVSRGDTVAVFGCGGVGDAAIAAAALAGARTIVAIDVDDRKLEWARRFGATHTVNAAATDPVEAVRQLTGGFGADLVVEAVGRPETYRQAFFARDLAGHARPGRGAGSVHDDRVADDRVVRPGRSAQVVVVRGLLAVAGLSHAHRPVPSGRLDLDGFVSETIDLGAVEQAFDRMQRGEVLRSVVVI